MAEAGSDAGKEQLGKHEHRGGCVDVEVEELDRRADQAGKQHLARRVDGLICPWSAVCSSDLDTSGPQPASYVQPARSHRRAIKTVQNSGAEQSSRKVRDPSVSVHTLFVALAIIAIALQCLSLYMAFFGPDLPYEVKDPLNIPLDGRRFCSLLASLTEAKFLYGNRVEVLTDGPCFYETELAAIAGAQKSINLEAYIFHRGEVSGASSRLLPNGLGQESKSVSRSTTSAVSALPFRI